MHSAMLYRKSPACPVCNIEVEIDRAGYFECQSCGLNDHECNLIQYGEDEEDG